MVQELVQLLTAAEVLELCGLEAALSQPRVNTDAEGWLKGLLENICGARSYESVIATLIEDGQEVDALMLAARANERRQPISASLQASVETIWHRWLSDYEQDKTAIEGVLVETADNAGGFEDDRLAVLTALESF